MKTKMLLLDIVIIIILACIGWIYTFGIEEWLDIGLADETYYLIQGLLLRKGIPSAKAAPLYSFWYFILSIIKKDSVELYYFQYKLMTILPVLGLFIALRTYRVSRLISFLVSVWFLNSSINFDTWPKVCHFALLMLFFCFALISLFTKVRVYQIVIFVSSVFLLSYVRPEYFLSFLASLPLLISYVYKESRKQYTILALFLLSGVFIIMALLGIPFGRLDRGLLPPLGDEDTYFCHGREREIVAFGQHYALNWAKLHGDTNKAIYCWDKIIKDDFGNINHPVHAILSNPVALARHVAQNIIQLPFTFWTSFCTIFPHPYPSRISFKLSILLFIFFLSWNFKRKDKFRKFLCFCYDNIKQFKLPLICLVIALLPELVSVILIYPRKHYLLLVGMIFLLIIIIVLYANTEDYEYNSPWLIIYLFVLSVILIRPIAFPLEDYECQPALRTIKYLRKIQINKEKPIILELPEEGYICYAPDKFRRSALSWKDVIPSLQDNTISNIVDVILLSEVFGTEGAIIGKEWSTFLKSPAENGFVEIKDFPLDGRRLFIKEDLHLRETLTN